MIDVIRCGYNLRKYNHAQQHLLAVTYDFTAYLFPHHQIGPVSFGTVPGHRPNSVSFFFFTDIQLNQIFNILFCSLDFMSFSIGQPNANGDCATDVFKVTGADNLVPNICGDNAGQHSKFNSNSRNFCQFMLNCIHFPLVYLDVPSRSAGTSMTSPASREINLSFQLGAQSSASRMWNIKVSMLPSGSKYLGMPAHFKLLIY